MIVVIDTNIWEENLFLQSPAAAAVRFFLRRKGARVALPEVIKWEVQQHLRERINSYMDATRDNHDRILKIFGNLKELRLPTESNVNEVIENIFQSIGVETFEVPFTFESSRASFLRLIHKLPPSFPKQQFKDGVIWEDCLKLLEDDDVWLVTRDAGFFLKNETKLEPRLAKKLESATHNFRLIPSLSELLEGIKVDIQFENSKLIDSIFSTRNNDRALEITHGFSLTETRVVKKSIFATENPETLYVTFETTTNCKSVFQEEQLGTLEIQGAASYNTKEDKFQNVRLNREELQFETADNERKSFGVVYASADIHLGHRTIERELRYFIGN